MIDCSQDQARSLFLSLPGSLTIIKQLEVIKSLPIFSTDWTLPKPSLSALRHIKRLSQGHIGPPDLRRRLAGLARLGDIVPQHPRTLCGPTWRPLGSRLTSLHAPSWVMQQIAGSGEASSAEARRQLRVFVILITQQPLDSCCVVTIEIP